MRRLMTTMSAINIVELLPTAGHQPELDEREMLAMFDQLLGRSTT